MTYSYDPNTQTFIMANLPLGMSIGSADSASQSLMSSENFQTAESLSRFRAQNESQSYSDAEGGGVALSETVTRSRGRIPRQEQDERHHSRNRLFRSAHARLC